MSFKSAIGKHSTIAAYHRLSQPPWLGAGMRGKASGHSKCGGPIAGEKQAAPFVPLRGTSGMLHDGSAADGMQLVCQVAR